MLAIVLLKGMEIVEKTLVTHKEINLGCWRLRGQVET